MWSVGRRAGKTFPCGVSPCYYERERLEKNIQERRVLEKTKEGHLKTQ